jgi:hypothetical protein
VRDGWLAAATALAARGAVVAWAAGRFPPSADGLYYDLLARRLAEGHGYTWLWPDGAVTSVAHYPVGYPAMLALAYLAAGARPAVAMGVNALFGAGMALAVHRLARDGASRAGAMGAALVVALHPALVPYTAAVMTEGVAAALVVIAVAVARGRFRRAWIGWALAGLALSAATLVRPQCLGLAPLMGMLAPAAPAAWATRARSAALVTALTLAPIAPWTARNCVEMHRCALVSVNGGWNLLIGAQTTNGSWQPAQVPEACRTVWDEAGKDACFARAAEHEIAAAPVSWLARAPAKVAVTLDYFGAGPWYLHEANAAAFSERAKEWLGAAETIVSRILLLFALLAVTRAEGGALVVRRLLCGVGVAFAVTTPGWVAYLALAAAILALGPRPLSRAPVVVPFTAVLILVTVATHAVFFGAGRYGLVVVPFVSALPFLALARPARPIAPLPGASPATGPASGSPSAPSG